MGRDGRLVAIGSVSQVATHGHLARLYFGVFVFQSFGKHMGSLRKMFLEMMKIGSLCVCLRTFEGTSTVST